MDGTQHGTIRILRAIHVIVIVCLAGAAVGFGAERLWWACAISGLGCAIAFVLLIQSRNPSGRH